MSENLMPHIRLPKDLDVDCVLLPGDPARADTVASHLEDARLLASNREFRSWQGTYKGKKMLVTSTGIGAASCAIAVEELIQCGVHNLIRIGSCGALQPECTLGDLILVTGAIRDDGTSAAYVEAQYPAIPDFDLLSACRESAVAENIPYHLGICRSHSCLYGDRNPELYSYWAGKRAIASDMETAVLFGTRFPSWCAYCIDFKCCCRLSVLCRGRYWKICCQRGNFHEWGRKRNSYSAGSIHQNPEIIKTKISENHPKNRWYTTFVSCISDDTDKKSRRGRMNHEKDF